MKPFTGRGLAIIFRSIFPLTLGALSGAYIGLVLVRVLIVGPIGEGRPLAQYWIGEITSTAGRLTESAVIFTGFTFLGMALAYSFSTTLLLRKVIAELTAALEVNKTKDEFISMVLHHLRTPLSGLKWSFKEILKEPKVMGQHRADLERLREENNRALGAVEHLIEASQASMQRITYNFEVVKMEDLLGLIKKSITQMQAKAFGKEISFEADMPPASENSLKLDREKITTVVQTLLDNAIAYTNKGGKIKIRTEEKEPHFFFSVSDNGIGISEKDKSRVFLQFSRGENARRMEPGGFGIGLFIAKTFIERHNGKIWFVSEEGKGATFSFRIPVIETPTEKFLKEI